MSTKYSQFPQAIDINTSDSVVGLQGDENTRFTFSTILAWIRTTVSQFFVPTSRKVNNKALSSDISLDASDVGAVDALDVGVAGGVAGLDSNGKVPTSQLPTMPSDVEANPSGAATDTLTKLEVDSIIYAVGGGVDYLTVSNGKICVVYEVSP